MNNFSEWLSNDNLGQYLLRQEQAFASHMVEDEFGFSAVQLGLSAHRFLSDCRIAKHGFIDLSLTATIRAELSQLPFSKRSLDLVMLPHTLDFSHDPHSVLSEAKRVLRPGGKLVLIGFNPYSLWGIRHFAARRTVPWSGHFLRLSRIKDWMKLLDLEIECGQFMAYVPPVQCEIWLNRMAFMEKAGDRWWPLCAGVYGIKAVKKVRGVHLLRPEWKSRSRKVGVLSPAGENRHCNEPK